MPGEGDRNPESNEDRLIRLSIEDAQAEERPITHQAARLIAGRIHGGQRSAVYELASSGAIDVNGIMRELVLNHMLVPALEPMYYAVARYVNHHGKRGRVEGWHELTTDEAIETALRVLENTKQVREAMHFGGMAEHFKLWELEFGDEGTT